MEYYFHFCDQFMGTQGRMSSFSLGAPWNSESNAPLPHTPLEKKQ